MQLKYKLWGLLLILSLAQVSRAQLKCYICENCAEVSASTPLLDCDEDFFAPGASTEPSTQTTTTTTTDMTPTGTSETTTVMTPTSSTTATPTSTETSSSTSDRTTTVSTTESTTSPITTTSTESSTLPITTTEGTSSDSTTTSTNTSSSSSTSSSTTTMSSTTNDGVSPTTSERSTVTTDSTTRIDTTTNGFEGFQPSTNATENTQSTNSTEPQPPTPSTAHPMSSIPTPPNTDSETPLDDFVKYSVNGTDSDRFSTKPYIASSQFRVRQARSVSDYTYHCFKVSTSVNGSMITNRGCSRVKTMESVCSQWINQHPTVKLNKCNPCSNTRCNGSTALNVSLAAIALTLVAVVLQRK